jgi:hypothetical protein
MTPQQKARKLINIMQDELNTSEALLLELLSQDYHEFLICHLLEITHKKFLKLKEKLFAKIRAEFSTLYFKGEWYGKI